ncbi:MAG: DUF2911 domain-containing protein [Acidobacteria bacterium]|nr:DUF2911 domain-containing protein [Acidobacteriota bacterium]
MTRKNLSFLAVLSGLVFLVACGGGMPEEAADEPMPEAAPAEPEPAPEPASSTPEMLGGGKAMEVHPGQGGSPHVTVDWMVNDANISITYGRPYLRDRVVGESVEPMDTGIWRLGADEATTLVTDKDLMIGDAHIPAGEYTLWAGNMGGEFHLIVNSQTGQWGTQYDSGQDVAHVAMEVGDLDPPADQLTLSVSSDAFSFDWGQMTASVPITIHD